MYDFAEIFVYAAKAMTMIYVFCFWVAATKNLIESLRS